MEDLDGERCRPEFADAILRDLEWLGLCWDGPVILQSEQAAAHQAALEKLRRAGLCYPCVCTRREIREAASAPQAPPGAASNSDPGAASAYPGTCRGRFKSGPEADAANDANDADAAGAAGAANDANADDADGAAGAASGRPVAWRLRVEPGAVSFSDGLYGAQSFDPGREVGDFPIARRDGQAAYQLAVVVDDAAAGVTEVMRARDLLPSTARQVLLLRHLGLAAPSWTHLPLVLDQHGQRLAKRSDALSLQALREAGKTPGQIVAWAAASAGLHGEDPQLAPDPADPKARPSDYLATFRRATLTRGDVQAPSQF
jgi:glutamyl-tRNA synthetase